MKTHTVTTYEFSELDDKAKQVAIEWMRRVENEDFDSSSITEMFCERLDELGYPHDGQTSVQWSLSYSQGDGVAFYGPVDLLAVAKRLLDRNEARKVKRIVDKGVLTITLSRLTHHYSHYNTMGVDYEYLADPIPEVVTKLIDLIKADIKDVSRKLEKIGYAEIEYRNSDEYLTDLIEGNDYEFYKDGRRADDKHLG